MSDFRISQVAASPSMTEPSTSGSERKLDRPAVVLGARSICKSFGRRAAAHQVLFDVDVDVYEGECLAVIGGSGSGKSTLTRIMLGLENADGGTVEYRGTPVLRGGSGLRRLRHDSGLIYQDPYGSLDPRWTVGDIVAGRTEGGRGISAPSRCPCDGGGAGPTPQAFARTCTRRWNGSDWMPACSSTDIQWICPAARRSASPSPARSSPSRT